MLSIRTTQGSIHPDTDQIFSTPKQYMRWYERTRLDNSSSKRTSSRAPVGSPVVAILLYRKHVITQQGYIAQMIATFEEQGLIPLPIFINGVEAHTIVRDLLTTR
jgi:magnesium chelatase subunit H